MANEKRLIYFDDAIERIVNFPSKVAHDNFYGKKQFTPIQMLNALADRQHEIIDQLEKVRTVDAVEVVHAEWLDGYGVCDNKKSYISIDCSNCGEYFKLPSIDENIEEWKKRFAYCPFCGAKMDGDGNG